MKLYKSHGYTQYTNILIQNTYIYLYLIIIYVLRNTETLRKIYTIIYKQQIFISHDI